MAMELSHREIRELLDGQLNKDRSSDDMYIYVKDVFEDTVVYEEDGVSFRATFEIGEGGVVTLGTPERVKIAYEKFAELSGVAVLRVGTFTSADGRSITFTESDLDEVLQNFNDIPNNKVPLSVSHADGETSEMINALTVGAPLIAYMKDLMKTTIDNVPTLMAGFGDVAEKAVEMIGKQLVRVSPEIFGNFIDNDGHAHGKAFKRISFVDRSSMRELPDVTEGNLAFSEGSGQDSLVIILHEDVSGKTNEGGDTNMDSKLLTDMQEKYDALAAKFTEQGAQLAEALKLSETAKAAEAGAVAKLSEAATAAHKKGIGDFITTLKADGKLAPAMEPTVQSFMEALSHGEGSTLIKFGEAGKEQDLDSLALFKEMLSGKAPLISFSELAEGGGEAAGTKVTGDAKKVMDALGVSDGDIEKYGEGPVKE